MIFPSNAATQKPAPTMPQPAKTSHLLFSVVRVPFPFEKVFAFGHVLK